MEKKSYYRRLDHTESQRLWETLQKHWSVTNEGWFPVIGTSDSQDYIVFDASRFLEAVPLHVLHQFLKTHGIDRVWEIVEDRSGCEMDVYSLDPEYTGLEGYWTSSHVDWLIYASHEHSLTIAGQWLIDALKDAWPQWEHGLYER